MALLGYDQEQQLIEELTQAKDFFVQSGEPFRSYADQVNELTARLQKERLHLAVLGQFKRGKSSLINALLSGDFLPISSIPMTALPTVIRWGNKRQAIVVFHNGQVKESDFSDDQSLKTFLTQYVAEEQNPCNQYGVKYVEVEYPAQFLAGGVVLIDTPGIGSTFTHNTETTLQFLIQCDVALFVVSADPPITASEIEFLQSVQKHIKKLFFVLNKIDYLNEAERETVFAFLRKVLQEQGNIAAPILIYELSARQALIAKQTEDEHLLRQSGLDALEADLFEFFQKEKKQVLVDAIKAKFVAVLREAALEINLSIKAMELPIVELEAKKDLLLEKLAAINEEQKRASDLLVGDKKRTLEFLETQSEILRGKAREHLMSMTKLPDDKPSEFEKKAFSTLAQIIPTYFEQELNSMTDIVGNHIASILKVHQQRADELVGAVRQAAANVFAIDYQAKETIHVFQIKRKPYWVSDKWETGTGSVSNSWFEALLPNIICQARSKKRIEKHIDQLVTHNVENLRWALLQNTESAFREFSVTLKMRLSEAINSTSQAIDAAITLKNGQVQTEETHVNHMRSIARQIEQHIQRIEDELH